MKRQLLFALVLIVLCSGIICGQTKKFSAVVAVQVVSSNAADKSIMYSYLTRELRSLNDVTIVTGAPAGDYTLIIMLENLTNETDGSYALTSLFTKRASCIYAQPLANGSSFVDSCGSLESFQSISILKASALKQKASQIVTDFDANVLEADRKRFTAK